MRNTCVRARFGVVACSTSPRSVGELAYFSSKAERVVSPSTRSPHCFPSNAPQAGTGTDRLSSAPTGANARGALSATAVKQVIIHRFIAVLREVLYCLSTTFYAARELPAGQVFGIGG